MAEYTASVNATSNGTANTDDMFIEIKAPTSTTVLVKRIRVSSPATTPADNEVLVTVTRNTGAGTFTSGTGFTPIKRRTSAPVSVITSSTCIVKNGTNGATVGAGASVVLKTAFNQRGIFEWIARDKDDYIETGSGEYIEVLVQCSAVSQKIAVEMDWEE